MKIGKWNVTIKDFVWFIICLIIVLCFCVGVMLKGASQGGEVLSGASTAVSIVLSLVAILYTMIEGANSTQVNQDTINKLSSIDIQLKEVTGKLVEVKELEKKMKYIVPQLDSAIQKIEEAANSDGDELIDEEVKVSVQRMLTYIREDIDE